MTDIKSLSDIKTRCVRIKLRPDSLPAVRAWQHFLEQNRNEVLKTLEAEGVTLEAAFLDNREGGDYLIYLMACEDFDNAKAIAANSKSFVDEFHKKFKQECWGESIELEPLISFQRHPE